MSSDKLHNLRPQSATEFRWCAAIAKMVASKAGLRQRWLKRTPVIRQAFAALPSWQEIAGAQNPEPTRRGIFVCLDPVALLPALEWRESVDQEKDAAQFHDSEAEDIYDLYNACDGILRDDGLLDVSQLDEFSPDEAQALNVPRLREIWEHTRGGCAECQRISDALNIVRQTITDKTDGGANGIRALDVNQTDSIS